MSVVQGVPVLHSAGPNQPKLSGGDAIKMSDDSGFELMDDSLTDMRWLQRMDAGSDVLAMDHEVAGRKRGRDKENHRIRGKDGCRKKLEYSSGSSSSGRKGGDSIKPPLSYASLIALAICSTPQRMLTLSGIYKWIESTFPFYRTPEAKAWKNSIRHNLSIRKNMFMKVFQYPPRRGNGSYWTLLSDGEEELKRAIPLFTTLLPPVIDGGSVYSRQPSTHTVKIKGQFVPVLPSTSSAKEPYFARSLCTKVANFVEVESDTVEIASSGGSDECEKDVTGPHLLDHSYSKQSDSSLSDDKQKAENEGESSVISESSFDVLSNTPKRRKIAAVRFSQVSATNPALPRASIRPSIITSTAKKETGHTPKHFSMTPSKDEDLGLLDTSFLTPLKNIIPDIGIENITFSPLLNFVTPRRGSSPASHPHPSLPSPFTPLTSNFPADKDSGIVSPLKSDLLLKFSTPMGSHMSPLPDFLPANALGTPNQDGAFSLLDSSSGIGMTPLRPGSLQGLGLPGLTPPSLKK